MQKYGKTRAGKQRFFCPNCKKSSTRKRKDLKEKNNQRLFFSWLGGKRSLVEIAKEKGITTRSLSKRFNPFLKKRYIHTPPKNPEIKTLIVDGKYIHKDNLCVLIALTDTGYIFFDFVEYESAKTWSFLLSRIPQPKVVVSDGQKGLMRVICDLWPNTKIQRCQFHIVSLVIQSLTKNPKKEASRELLSLLYRLKDIKTKEEKQRWILLFKILEKRYDSYLDLSKRLNEKERKVFRSIKRALPFLFTFLDYENVPNTTNMVEGGINSQIAERIRIHRGLSPSMKKILVTIFLSTLSKKLTEKPTQKFY